MTLTNPAPVVHDYFGSSVAAVGTDQVLIGVQGNDTGAMDAGAVYLISTSGVLLTAFTNPTPAVGDCFSWSVAAAGADQVLIGADGDDTGAKDAGAAYLFSANGVLITTFTNPTPAHGERFGYCMTAVGSSGVLIATPCDTIGAFHAGAAFLFSTNGALLATITKPTPAAYDNFGTSVAAVGSELVLIGASGYDAGVEDVGAAYLFSLEPLTPVAPTLNIWLTPSNTVAVLWPSPSTGWTLQEKTNGAASVNWSNAPGPVQDDGTNKTLIIAPPMDTRFYRLFKP
jgi:hypothetical protein